MRRGNWISLSAVSLLAGCSVAMGHHDAGIGHLEAAPAPVGALAVGGKYLGWLASAPAVIGLAPLAALAWATPWVDLPLAVDIASAPGIALGYATEALVGYPAYALFGWRPRAPAPAGLGPAVWRPRPGPGKPWGLVEEHWIAAAPPRPARPLSAADDARYAVPPGAAETLRARVLAGLDDAGRGAVVRLEDPEMPGALEVTRCDAPGPRPLVVMTPPTEAAFAARWLAERFARRGAHAAVVVPDADFLAPDLDAPAVERKLRAAVVLARTVVHALGDAPDVSEVLYVGVSAGGIFGAVLLAVEPRVARAALLLPGGDLPAIVATSQEAQVVSYREAWAARGVDAPALERALRAAIATEPLRLATSVDPRRVLLFLGARDTLVPTACGLRLRRALGEPETWVLAGDHDTACVGFGFILRRVDAFLFPE